MCYARALKYIADFLADHGMDVNSLETMPGTTEYIKATPSTK